MWFANLVSKEAPKIIGVGKNYLKHAIQMGGTDVPKEPLIFLKPWSSLVYCPTRLDLSKSGRNNEIHHELELGVVIGKKGYKIPKKSTDSYISGYLLGLDLTDRNLQAAAKVASFPWDMSKGQDNFCPITSLIDKKKVSDPYKLELELKINDQVKQKAMTGEMHFKIDDIVSFVSEYMTLNEGDIILTGTPSGVGPIKPGDKVLGELRDGTSVLSKLEFKVV